MAPSTVAQFLALAGVPLVKPGDDLAEIILAALTASGEKLRNDDMLIIAQKIVSKAQNRLVRLDTVIPSPEAERLAHDVNKDARLVELIMRESTETVRYRRDVLVVAHRLGFVIANAGIDQSNVEQGASDDVALLLPEDPDATCASLRETLRARTGASIGVIINDSHGRAFRNGTVGVAIGASGVAALADLRGAPDLFGRKLHSTEVAIADEIASAASLLMGQAGEGRPIVLARGLATARGDRTAADLVRPKTIDLFRPASLDEALKRRRSIRRYTAAPIHETAIMRLIEAAITAPSAHNRQPWRFVLLKDAAKTRLAQAMAKRLREDRTRDGHDPTIIDQDAARSITRITSAPAAILVCLSMEDMDVYPDRRRAAAERQMAVQSTAMAMQNILLAAHAEGLGASIMCAPLFCADTVRDVLSLSAAWEPQALITLGYPANSGRPYRRHPIQDVVRIVDV